MFTKKKILQALCTVIVIFLIREMVVLVYENEFEKTMNARRYNLTDINQLWNETISELYGFEWNDIRISEVIVSKSHSRHDSSISLITESESEYNSISNMLSSLPCISYEHTYELPFVTLNDIDYYYDLSSHIGRENGSVIIYRLVYQGDKNVKKYLTTRTGILSSDIDRILDSLQ